MVTLQTNTPSFYETQQAISQYLLFHYGDLSDLMPYAFGPKEGWDFPVRCVRDCVNLEDLPPHATALELGCAVGRTCFELSRYFEKVTGIDYSYAFIEAARKIQSGESLPFIIKEEGSQTGQRYAALPKGVRPERVEFLCEDALHAASLHQTFDVVIAANLLCRLKDPKLFLSQLKNLVSFGGKLILTAPYSWLEEYTPKEQWLQGRGIQALKEILEDSFRLQRYFDLPFLIREHYRKFQWGVAQASIWKRSEF